MKKGNFSEPPRGATFTLGDTEMHRVRHSAKERYAVNRTSNPADMLAGRQTDYQTILRTIGAELGFLRIFGLDGLCIRYNYAARSLSGWWFPDEWNEVNVRVTTCPDGKLIVTSAELQLDIGRFVMMVGNIPTFTYAGYDTKADLLIHGPPTDLAHGPVYILGEDRLRPLEAERPPEDLATG